MDDSSSASQLAVRPAGRRPRYAAARQLWWVAVGAGITLDLLRYEPGARYAPHSHDSLDVSLVLRGRLVEAARRQEFWAGGLGLSRKAPGCRHSDLFGPEPVEILRLRIEASRVEDEPEACATGGWHWTTASPAAAELLALAQRLRHEALTEDCAERAREIVQLAGPSEDDAGRRPGWLARAEEAIRERLRDGLSVGLLAAEIDRHPTHVTRVFRRVHGTSVTGYVRRLRVRGALDSIRSSDRGLAGIAADWGFSDQAHMCRCVKRQTGLTPGQLRTLGRAG